MLTDDNVRLDDCNELIAMDEVPQDLDVNSPCDATSTLGNLECAVEQDCLPENPSKLPTFGYKPLDIEELPKKPYYYMHSTTDSHQQGPTADDKHRQWLMDMENLKGRTCPRHHKTSPLPAYGTIIRRGSQNVVISAVGSNITFNQDFQEEDDPNIIDLTGDMLLQGEGGRTDLVLREQFQDKTQSLVAKRIVRKGSTKITMQVQARCLSPECDVSSKDGKNKFSQETRGEEMPKVIILARNSSLPAKTDQECTEN